MDRLDESKATYRRFIDILNAKEFDALPQVWTWTPTARSASGPPLDG